MSVSAALGDWYRHDVTVERFTGSGPSGDVYSTATDELGMVDDTRRLVRAADGGQVVSSTTVYLPSSTTPVPVGSRVTLPTAFGTPLRRSIVLAVSVHNGGGRPTPDHVQLALQ